MNSEELTALFDQQAPSYDQQWAKLASFREALHLLLGAVFSELPSDARVLCVGAGTGAEMIELARRFPGWTFTAVEPSAQMLEVCRRRADESGLRDRCSFHQGFLESLPPAESFDVATSLLVSQFLLEPEVRSSFFRSIARRLRPGGILASSDLSFDTSSELYPSILEVWFRVMAASDLSPEGLERMRAAYARDVSILPAREVEDLIRAGGFEKPVQLFQAGLIHAWYARRAAQG